MWAWFVTGVGVCALANYDGFRLPLVDGAETHGELITLIGLRWLGALVSALALLLWGVYLWRVRVTSFRHHCWIGLCSLPCLLLLAVGWPETSPLQVIYREVPSTEWKDGFCMGDFLLIEKGMSKRDVEACIGVGWKSYWWKVEGVEENWWCYSGVGASENYWRCCVQFDERTERVTGFRVYYWFD